MPTTPHILIAGGGNLGCIYPGLSIARQLLQSVPNARITIAGDGRAIERHTVRAAGLRYASVPSAARPRNMLEASRYVARNFAGWCVAQWLVREVEADLVVSLGGSTSGAVVRAARDASVPYLLVEQGSAPYHATSDFAKQAAAVCLAHESAGAGLPFGTAATLTGAVGRPGFEDAFAQRPGDRDASPSDDGRPRLVVLGGAGGATSLNESAPEAIRHLGEAAGGWQIVHQSGEGWLTATEKRYRQAGVEAVVISYIDELANLARAADLVVCRPGGSTLAELALAGLPAVLVPDGRRGDSRQESNARHAKNDWGCPVVREAEGSLPLRLAEGLRPLMVDLRARQQVSDRLVSAARPQASAEVAAICLQAMGLQKSPRSPSRPAAERRLASAA